MEYNYCRRCGAELQAVNHEELRCSNGHSIFPAPVPGAGVIFVDDDNNIYLTRRGREPDKGMLGMIGGFMGPGETAEQTAIREAEEESGLTPDDYGPLHYLCSSTHPYLYQDENRIVLSINYYARLHDKNVVMTPGDDAAAIEKIHIDQIDPAQIHGTETNNTVIYDLLRQRIKGFPRD